jgi:hypothetical protein
MIDTDTIVATVTPSSTFECSPAGVRDSDADDLDRLGASLDSLAFCNSKLSAQEAGDHVTIEPMGAHKQCFGSAMRAAGE